MNIIKETNFKPLGVHWPPNTKRYIYTASLMGTCSQGVYNHMGTSNGYLRAACSSTYCAHTCKQHSINISLSSFRSAGPVLYACLTEIPAFSLPRRNTMGGAGGGRVGPGVGGGGGGGGVGEDDWLATLH